MVQTTLPLPLYTYTAEFSRPTTVTSGQVPGGYAYVVADWKDANGRDVQAYWKIGGMGHAWSGGNPAGTYTDPRGPNASIALYSFFMTHSLVSGDRQSIASQTRLRRILADFFKIKRV